MPTLAVLIDAYEHPGRQVGEFCKRGHERAVYERRYPRAGGGSPIRRCMLCHREHSRNRIRTWGGIRYQAASTAHPDDLLWQRFCATVEQRIQAVRAQTPRCGECGRSA